MELHGSFLEGLLDFSLSGRALDAQDLVGIRDGKGLEEESGNDNQIHTCYNNKGQLKLVQHCSAVNLLQMTELSLKALKVIILQQQNDSRLLSLLALQIRLRFERTALLLHQLSKAQAPEAERSLSLVRDQLLKLSFQMIIREGKQELQKQLQSFQKGCKSPACKQILESLRGDIGLRYLALAFALPFLVYQSDSFRRRCSEMAVQDFISSGITFTFLILAILQLIAKADQFKISFKNSFRVLILVLCSVLVLFILNLHQENQESYTGLAVCILLGALFAHVQPGSRPYLALFASWVIIKYSQIFQIQRFVIFFNTIKVVQIINEQWNKKSFALSTAMVICLKSKMNWEILLIIYLILENIGLLDKVIKIKKDMLIAVLPSLFLLKSDHQKSFVVPASVLLFLYDNYLSQPLSNFMLRLFKVDPSYFLLGLAVIASSMYLQLDLHQAFVALALLRLKLQLRQKQSQEIIHNNLFLEECLFIFYFSFNIKQIEEIDISVMVMAFLFGLSFISFYSGQVLKPKINSLRLVCGITMPLLISMAIKLSQPKEKSTENLVEIGIFYFLAGCSLGTILFVVAKKKTQFAFKILGGYKTAAVITRAIIQ